jgi:hypothetical protein
MASMMGLAEPISSYVSSFIRLQLIKIEFQQQLVHQTQ